MTTKIENKVDKITDILDTKLTYGEYIADIKHNKKIILKKYAKLINKAPPRMSKEECLIYYTAKLREVFNNLKY